ncbi:hypothetical protein llap_4167 [Limosa lapponica baueri]|uniref:Uncharacterized protein n=1 Tax=Limosa lapponica baueri TaxID=1758121 RepID=A0A2I0UHL2_LIMLA|nr:hypothetical protein llap_4167 [Limosa lapponica baueri]
MGVALFVNDQLEHVGLCLQMDEEPIETLWMSTPETSPVSLTNSCQGLKGEYVKFSVLIKGKSVVSFIMYP